MDRFTLTIELGNDAMQTPADVADMLATIAERLTDVHAWEGMLPDKTEGRERDANGNTVAHWRVT